MRLGEYLEVGKKMKLARTTGNISQKKMAELLSLSSSAYSNYENGYSEPPAEIILQFCNILHISLSDLLAMPVSASKVTSVKTFSEFISILIDLDRRGIPIKANTTYTVYGNQLTAHLTLDIENAQIATFIPDWNKTNEALAAGEITPEEYEFWLNNTLQIFNVRIDDYVYRTRK